MGKLSKNTIFKNVILGIIDKAVQIGYKVQHLSPQGVEYESVAPKNANIYDVKIPAFNNGILAEVKSIVNYNFRVDDVVYIGFIDGDRQKPVILNYASWTTSPTETILLQKEIFFMNYYYHNAGRTNWNTTAEKKQLLKGEGKIHHIFPAGEQLGLTAGAEEGKLYGHPKIYSVQTFEQIGEDLPAGFIAWHSNSINLLTGINNNDGVSMLRKDAGVIYDYTQLTKQIISPIAISFFMKDILGYTETKTYETEIIFGEPTECLKKITWNIYNWNSEIIDTIEYEFSYPQIFSATAWADGFVFSVLKADLKGNIYISLCFNYMLSGASFPLDFEEYCYFYNGNSWEKIGSYLYKSDILGRKTFINGEGVKITAENTGVINPFYNYGDEYLLAFKKDYTQPVLDGSYVNDFKELGASKTNETEILFKTIFSQVPYNMNICNNNVYGFAYNNLINKELTYTVLNIAGSESEKTINLPLSDNSSNFQIKEAVITNDNIVYFVYHDISNSKIGVIGLDIIANTIYYQYEQECISFPTIQKLFHYGSYIGFNNGANWIIIKGDDL